MAESIESKNLPQCACTTAVDATGGDGLAKFKPDPNRQIKCLSEITERGWYSLEVKRVVQRMSTVTEDEEMEPRVGHSLVTNPNKKEIYIIGGGNHLGETSEFWKIDYSIPEEQFECELDPAFTLDFTGRYEFFCGLNKSEEKIWIFGGADMSKAKNDVCYIDINRGTVVRKTSSTDVDPECPHIPTQRTQGNNSCFIQMNNEDYLVIFGGGVKAEKSVPDGHLYMYKISKNVWTRLEINGPLPHPVQGHGMVGIDSRIYIHGGMENMELFDDFFMIDLSKIGPIKWNKIQTIGPQPPARAAHGITVIENEIFIFGGVGEIGSLSDLWKYNLESNQWFEIDSGIKLTGDTEIPAIPPRLDFAMTNFNVQMIKPGGSSKEDCQMILIHGGMNIMGHLFDDFWIYPINI